ncbi:unnamed protein product [Thlaspi arvense]|uniref:RRM domain-containing protein n=1 Tax=Thlaspi arvense TaxID=13288 RepID=A0AAU9SV31_THLAR|nr:unnamed protein product [Thlaspi arvense]
MSILQTKLRLSVKHSKVFASQPSSRSFLSISMDNKRKRLEELDSKPELEDSDDLGKPKDVETTRDHSVIELNDSEALESDRDEMTAMNKRESIFVKGFSCSPPRDKIKRALKKHFSSCGPVTGIFVPFHCKTGSPLGYAFINMGQEAEKALKLDGSCLGGENTFCYDGNKERRIHRL